MKRLTLWMSFVALMAMVFTTAPANADFLTPVSVTASSYDIYHGPNLPENMIDISGLSTNSVDGEHVGGMWRSARYTAPADQWAIFDLGDKYNLTQAYIWNYRQGSPYDTRATKTMDIYVSAVSANGPWAQVGDTVTLIKPADAGPAEVVPLVVNRVRYVMFDILSSYGDGHVGLAEVRFEGVPTPAGMVLILK